MAEQPTLPLDEDVAKQLEAEARNSGRPFEIVGNEALRRFLGGVAAPSATPYRVDAKRMEMRPGYSLECVEQLLEELEGPSRR